MRRSVLALPLALLWPAVAVALPVRSGADLAKAPPTVSASPTGPEAGGAAEGERRAPPAGENSARAPEGKEKGRGAEEDDGENRPGEKATEPPGKRDLPSDYRSGAVPNESAASEGRMERAEYHLARQEWSAGLAILDEILAEVTSPGRRRMLRSAAVRRRRALERALREEEARGDEREAGDRLGLRPGQGPAGPQFGDDERSPTVEVYSRDGIRYLPVAAAVRERLMELPEEALSLYQRTYEAPAEEALRRATRLPFLTPPIFGGEANGLRELARAAERYPGTAAGRRAWEELASRLTDSGRPREGAFAFDVRCALPFRASDSDPAQAWALAAYCHLLAGHVHSGRRALEHVATAYSEEAIPVRGVAVLGASLGEHELFRALAEAAAERSRPPSSWPCPLGSFEHAGSPLSEAELPPLGSEARWLYRLRELETTPKKSSVSRRGYPALQVVSYGDLAYVRREAQVVAIDLETGKTRWTADPGPRPEPAPSPGYSSSSRSDGDYTDQGGKALGLYRPGPNEPAVVTVVDHTSGVRITRGGKPAYAPNRLIGYDARNGKIRWRVGDKVDRSGPGRGLAYTAPPTPVGDLLVAPATREGGYYVVGISARGGTAKVRWVSRLYSFNVGYFRRYGFQMLHGSTVAAGDGAAYAAPGHGLVCAVESGSGRLIWMSRYRSRTRSTGSGYSVHSVRWVHTHPMFIRRPGRDLVVAAPQDSDFITAYDAASGEILWDERYETGQYHLLGSDGERLFLAGEKVLALSLEGEALWESEPLAGGQGGQGFVGAGRIYVPGFGGTLSVLATRDGDLLERFRILEPRVPTGEPFNLFPAAGRLLAVSRAAVVSIRPQEDTWSLLGAEGELFRRARVFRGAAQYDKALEVLYRLEETYREGKLHDKLVRDLTATVAEAVEATKETRYIRELLARERKIVKGRGDILAWRLREAGLMSERSPAEAVPIYLDLLKEDGRTARSSENNRVDVSVYASEALRELLQREPESAGEEGGRAAARGSTLDDALADWPELAKEEEETRAKLEAASGASGGASSTRLKKIAIRRSHTPSAAEASALLAALARARGEPRAAANHLALLLEDYPSLRGVEAIEGRLRDLETELRQRPQIFRVGPSGSSGAGDPPGGAPPVKEAARAWKEGFWHATDEGVAVAGGSGSAPLPVVMAIRAQKLRAFDTKGRPLLERELFDFPDVEDIKTSLQSNLEEPAVAHLRDDMLVLFTAAGCYGFDCKGAFGEDGAGILESGALRFKWAHTYDHALQPYAYSGRFGWGTISVKGQSNVFPEVLFSPEGHPIILHPDGEFLSIHRRNGKVRWRFPGEGRQVVGAPYRQGDYFCAFSVAPPGVIRYRLPSSGGPTGERRGRASAEFLEGPEGSTHGYSVDGVAAVFHGRQLAVLSEGGRRTLWTRSTASRLVFATADAVWTSNFGNLKARALRSGREKRVIELPSNTTVVAVFEDVESGGTDRTLTLVTSGGNALYGAGQRGSFSRNQTGTKLHLVRLDSERKRIWARELAEGPVTYDGQRLFLEDGRWLLVYNEQEVSTEKWYTRVVAVSPEDGETELWLETEVSGKGTGQLPRLCAAAGGIVVANADGFGWFTRSGETGEEAETALRTGGAEADVRGEPAAGNP